MSLSTISSGPGALRRDSVLWWVWISLSIWQLSLSIMDWKDSRLCLSRFSPSAFTANYITSSDEKRLMKAGQKAECTSQRQRKSLRSRKLATEEGHIAEEGITYESGAFWSPPLFYISFYIFWRWIYFTSFIWSDQLYFYSVFFQSQAFLLIHLRWP